MSWSCPITGLPPIYFQCLSKCLCFYTHSVNNLFIQGSGLGLRLQGDGQFGLNLASTSLDEVSSWIERTSMLSPERPTLFSRAASFISEWSKSSQPFLSRPSSEQPVPSPFSCTSKSIKMAHAESSSNTSTSVTGLSLMTDLSDDDGPSHIPVAVGTWKRHSILADKTTKPAKRSRIWNLAHLPIFLTCNCIPIIY
jgi:hypothetical protein